MVGQSVRRVRRIFTVAAAAAVIGAGGVAWAAAETAEEPIHACVSKGLLGVAKG